MFEEEKNVPVNETDSSAVKLSGSAEIKEKKQRICFPPEPILGTGTGHFHSCWDRDVPVPLEPPVCPVHTDLGSVL